ncbi:hypothetical protein Ahy_B10g105163 [Arachis hypogaea]|uniref:Transposase MuDR plant domain-containing protein n=1 Tax=Arachis hypogaea TaxID=3818 RepID=A0A444X7C1_ARAHY|nr:hypothetical protein Ahy_B10g105163 [Arachis hypogaea]
MDHDVHGASEQTLSKHGERYVEEMQQPQIELYVEFKKIEGDGIQNDSDIEDDRAAVCEGMNNDSKEDFEATYEADDKDEDGDVGVEAAAENVVVPPAVSQPIDVLPFMRNLDLDASHAPEIPEYANIGVADPKDGEFRIGMEYISRKSVVIAIRSYTISRGVDYNVYNGRHTCTMRTISQDHSKLGSDTVAEARRPLVETDLSIEVKSIIAEVQSRHIVSNFLREFKVPHFQKLVVNIGYSKTVEEYNINYQRLQERECRIETNIQRAGNIVVHRFDRRNEVFEVREMPNEKVLQSDCGYFQGHRRSRCPQRARPSGVFDDVGPSGVGHDAGSSGVGHDAGP